MPTLIEQIDRRSKNEIAKNINEIAIHEVYTVTDKVKDIFRELVKKHLDDLKAKYLPPEQPGIIQGITVMFDSDIHHLNTYFPILTTLSGIVILST